MLIEHRIATPKVELNYAEGPSSGPPFVLLHGGGARWQAGLNLLEALAEQGWHVFAPDLRGHGKSGRVKRAYYLKDYVADLEYFLQHAVPERPVVFGHSLGGEIAVMLAGQKPDLFRALIVGDAPLTIENHATEDPDHRAMNELWITLAGRPSDKIEPALREMPIGSERLPARVVMGDDHPWFRGQAETLSELDPDMLAAVLDGPEVMLAGYDPHILLPAITCPVLLLQADPRGPLQGGILRDDEVGLAMSLLPNATHVLLHGIGHPLHSPDNQTGQVLEAIQPFLASL
jgi:pimeloyl-ACP methyl ester carboxylesterase